jgi:hypothetical protein
VGGAGGIHGTHAEGEREKMTGVSKGIIELSGKVLKTCVI